MHWRVLVLCLAAASLAASPQPARWVTVAAPTCALALKTDNKGPGRVWHVVARDPETAGAVARPGRRKRRLCGTSRTHHPSHPHSHLCLHGLSAPLLTTLGGPTAAWPIKAQPGQSCKVHGCTRPLPPGCTASHPSCHPPLLACPGPRHSPARAAQPQGTARAPARPTLPFPAARR